MRFSLLRRTLLAAILTALLVACSSTLVISEWRDPGYQGAALKKILVYVAAGEDATRRTAEDRLAASFPKGTQGVPSYTLFPDAKEINKPNEKAIASRLQKEGFDGALTARLVSVDKENVYMSPQTYLAPTMLGPYGSFYGYGTFAYSSVYTVPGYTYQETKYMIETILYEIPGGKMLWTMTSESVSPDSRQQLIKWVAGLIDDELKKQGFIAG
jgi:hypothetical protein